MKKTMIQKIFENHSDSKATIGDIINIDIDVRIARDFGGAKVIKNLEENNLRVDNPKKTFFTFDCNPSGCDQKYATNQHICRLFARKNNIQVFDINKGIGTHLALETGLTTPGKTLVSTDSHANIMGAIGAFGQGMGDIDIANVFAHGKIWFKIPPTIKIILKGNPSKTASAKDVVLKIIKNLGANGLLGYAAEIYGDYVNSLSLDGRITISSMATEMGGIILLFPPNDKILDHYRLNIKKVVTPVFADKDAVYEKTIEIDIDGLEPQISLPGHPEDVVDVKDVHNTKIDSGFVGSCTNGRFEDMSIVAKILKDKKIAPGRILKIVPATDTVWRRCLDEGHISIFKESGVLVGSAGCAGCANGQIGQTGMEERAISSGNRNFVGKQGKGDIFLASPATVAASLVAGFITTSDNIPEKSISLEPLQIKKQTYLKKKKSIKLPTKVEGRAWVIKKDNIDTDMIYHNRYLSITNIDEMGKYTFNNVKGFENFSKGVNKGDIIIVGKNFGSGSSRQQAVDCFISLGIGAIVAESFGAIYERNAINSGLPILTAKDITTKIDNNNIVSINFITGEIVNKTQRKKYQTIPFFDIQRNIYLRGGLLER